MDLWTALLSGVALALSILAIFLSGWSFALAVLTQRRIVASLAKILPALSASLPDGEGFGPPVGTELPPELEEKLAGVGDKIERLYRKSASGDFPEIHGDPDPAPAGRSV